MRQIVILALLLMLGGVAAVQMLDTRVPHAPPQVAAAEAAAPPSNRASRVVTIPSDRRGYFEVTARVDGRMIDFMVDTGASAVALRESTAARLGLRPSARDYTIRVSTANGVTKGAPVTLNVVDIDGVTVRQVDAIVQPDEVLPVNLLGMTYLSRVRFSHDRGRLLLEQ